MAAGSWAKIYCTMFRDPKIAALSDSQVVAFIRLILWSQEQETDGVIPEVALKLATVKRTHVDALVAEELMTIISDGWHITTFLDHQASADKRREGDRSRTDKARNAANARWSKDA